MFCDLNLESRHFDICGYILALCTFISIIPQFHVLGSKYINILDMHLSLYVGLGCYTPYDLVSKYFDISSMHLIVVLLF